MKLEHPPSETKICSVCKTEKNLQSFNKRRASKDGINNMCRDCSKERFRKDYEDNIEYYRLRTREYAKKNPENVKKNNDKRAIKVICFSCGCEYQSWNKKKPDIERACAPCLAKNARKKERNLSPTIECKKCKQVLERKFFGVRDSGHIRTSCIKCDNLKKFKMNRSDWDSLFFKQKMVCAICNKPETSKDVRTGAPLNLSVDHCHSSGKVRGLLCGNCNKGIGSLKDDITILKNAIKYLKRSLK